MNAPIKPYASRGFTLLEMSIVLTVIGLVVGGLLASRGMLEEAKVRKIISEKEAFDVAAVTFEAKYDALPGDIRAYEQIPNGIVRSKEDGHGDNDGLIEYAASIGTGVGGGGAPTTNVRLCGENLFFWADLSRTALINQTLGQYTQDGNMYDDTCFAGAITPATGLDKALPRSSAGNVHSGSSIACIRRNLASTNIYLLKSSVLPSPASIRLMRCFPSL